MSSILVQTLNLADEFAQASQRKDISYLEQLLSDSGEFEIQDETLETYDVTKTVFLDWYATKLNQTPISTISFDQCLHCQIGARVVLFNDGTFPRKLKDSSERVKAGFKVDSSEGKIVNLKFCFVFLETENKYKFECEIDRIKAHMGSGLSIPEILTVIKREDESDVL
jgi:hypothetical protein